MALAGLAVLLGLLLLVWSTDKFINGAVFAAHHFEIPPLLIGIVIIGFRTATPKMMESAISAFQGNSGLLPSAYGSNIANISLIIVTTVLIRPILVPKQVYQRDLPILLATTALTLWILWNGQITRLDALLLMGVFTIFMLFTIRQGLQKNAPVVHKEIKKKIR